MTQTTIYPTTIQNIGLYRVAAFQGYSNLTQAIFTRQGGVSNGFYASLNLSTATGDNAATVEQNFQLACQALDITPPQIAGSHLIHGKDVVTVTKRNQQLNMGRADGLITDRPGIFLYMRFADCTPLLFYDPVRQAVGLSHAGWRGTMQNVAGATISAMQQAFACQPENIIAVIGPAIGPCCYEVGDEVMTTAKTALADVDSLFSRHNGSQAHFDLWAANRQQLIAAGVGEIIETQRCTACHTDEFFSHRAEKGQTGRFGVIIGLKEETAS